MALSEQQNETIRVFKKLIEIGAPMSRETLKEAHREAYPQLAEAEPRILAAYVTQNLHSIQFIATLGFECRKMELFVGREILKHLRGKTPPSIKASRPTEIA
jgi:hypothetical protein